MSGIFANIHTVNELVIMLSIHQVQSCLESLKAETLPLDEERCEGECCRGTRAGAVLWEVRKMCERVGHCMLSGTYCCLVGSPKDVNGIRSDAALWEILPQ